MLANYYNSKKDTLFVVRLAQGLVHMGKVTFILFQGTPDSEPSALGQDAVFQGAIRWIDHHIVCGFRHAHFLFGKPPLLLVLLSPEHVPQDRSNSNFLLIS